MPPPVSLLRRALRAWTELGALGPLALFTVVAPAVGALGLVATSGTWFPPLQELGTGAWPWVLVATVLLAGLGLIPTHASSLVSGMLLGFVGGSALAVGATALAALFCHALVRRLVGDEFLTRLSSGVRGRAVHAELVGGGALRTAALIALVRLSPAMPFAATNLLLASAGVRVGTFLAGTVLGIAPRVLVVALAGAGLAEFDLDRGHDGRLLVLGALATVAALFVIGRLARRALRGLGETAAES